ncbi:MAG: hypothetical protein ACI4TK_07765 [Agathobacter sp.]
MSFLDLFRRKKKPNNVTVEENIQPVVLTDPKAINHYVIELCEQMIDISKEMEEVRQEYANVTAYFNDVSIVEGLEGEQKELLVDVATNVSKLAKARNDYLNAEHKISDEMFSLLDDNEAEIPGVIKRLQANETYLDAIKRDMNRLSGEKIEWSVLRQECEKEQKMLRKMSYTMLYVFGTIAIIVAMLSLTFRWDLFPLMVVAFLATVAGSYIVLRMQDRAKEIKKCDVNLNHAIALENRVKIKFVNIKNAIDYTCERFHVNNSMELTYNYEQYIEACKEREKFRQTSEDLEYFNGRLVRLLSGLHLYDAKIWLNYANAIIDPREMVEVKHDLFGRRQKLRSRIEYNLSAIEDMKKEVEKYINRMGEKEEQIRTILNKIDEINKGNTP